MSSFRITEEDYGSKKRALYAVVKAKPNKRNFDKYINDYLKKVRDDAKRVITGMGAVDTGTLRRSIRITRTSPKGKYFEVAVRPDDIHVTKFIVAGGRGWINPKTRHSVNYAASVHDGTGKNLKKGPRPFLTTAVDMNEAYLNGIVDAYLNDRLKEWGGS